MFRRFIFILLLLAFPYSADATIVVIRSGESEFSAKFISGFSFQGAGIQAYTYAADKEKSLLSKIKKLSPDLVLTVGPVPIRSLAKTLPTAPILVGGGSSHPEGKASNVVAMQYENAATPSLALVKSLFPNRGTIGTLFNPSHSQREFDALVKTAAELKLKVASLKVDTPKDVETLIGAFAGNVDLLYWIPDVTTADDSAVTAFYKFADQANIPVISWEPAHMSRGAILSITADPFKLGQQAWSVAKNILEQGKIPSQTVHAGPTELILSMSLSAFGRFGIGADRLFGFLQEAIRLGYQVNILK